MKKRHTIIRYLSRPHVFLILISAILIAWVSWGFALKYLLPHTWGNRGINGDMYGGLNTLFTGLAFAGLAYSICVQLSSRHDDDADRRKQQFETTFFQLLNSTESIIQSMDVNTSKGSERKGRDCFTVLFNRFSKTEYLEAEEFSKLDGVAKVKAAYEEFYAKHQTDLGHYYRTLYHLFKFIDERCPEDPQFYAKLVRAHLSSQQLLLLFYNCMHEVGHKFKDYIEKFALLKHMPKYAIANDSLLAFYSKSAYGEK